VIKVYFYSIINQLNCMLLIKIDPSTQTIEAVETNGQLNDLYRIIGCRTIDVCARQSNGDALTVDDEALLDEPQPPAFMFNGYGPLHGVALLTGCDEEGETVEPTMSLASVERAIQWRGHIHTEPFMAFIAL